MADCELSGQDNELTRRSQMSKRRAFVFNVCALIGTVVIMILTSVTVTIQKAVSDSVFLEKVADRIQSKIFEHLSAESGVDSDTLCVGEMDWQSFASLNTSHQFESYEACIEQMCK